MSSHESRAQVSAPAVNSAAPAACAIHWRKMTTNAEADERFARDARRARARIAHPRGQPARRSARSQTPDMAAAAVRRPALAPAPLPGALRPRVLHRLRTRPRQLEA